MKSELVLRILEELKQGFQWSFIVTQNLRDEVEFADERISFIGSLCKQLSSQDNRLICRLTLTHGLGLYWKGQLVTDQAHPVSIRFNRETNLGHLMAREGLKAEDLSERIQTPINLLPAFFCFLRSQDGPAILIVDGAEFLFPPDARNSLEDRHVLDLLLHWSRDPVIKESGSGIVLLYPHRGDVPDALLRDDQGFMIVREKYPDIFERQETLEQLGLNSETAAKVANLTTGMRRKDLREVISKRLSTEAIIAKKRHLIESRAGDLLEFVDSTFGLDQADAQPHVQTYLKRLAGIMEKDRKNPSVPMGVLFVGTPGNGKSHMAKAFAYDCRMNMLRLKNIRGRYVGESERNLETVLDLLPSLAPSVIFVDELDQLMGRRSEDGSNGDSGVERRLLGRLLAFMGDPENRGDILWIGATNRPDLLDLAAPRRFERTFAFLNPALDGRISLIRQISRRMQIPLEANISISSLAEEMEGYSCDDVEKVLRKAYEEATMENLEGEVTPVIRKIDIKRIVNVYRSTVSSEMSELVELLSIDSTGFLTDLPCFGPEGTIVGPVPRAIKSMIIENKLDEKMLKKRIDLLRRSIRTP